MRKWALGPNDARSLRLAADALAGPTDYVNDQIWDLHLGSGRPSALALETTYGRRARSLRIYPGFAADGALRVDPSQFVAAPVVEAFLPSWLRVRFSPIDGLEVEAEYWTPTSHVVAGRFRLTNTTLAFHAVRLVLFGVLDTSGDGRPMAPETRGGAVILTGRTKGLYPLIFLTGGAAPEAGPTPGLALTVDLAPHATRAVTWACAAESSIDDSFQAARAVAGRPWDAEIARIERIHSRWVDVETGDPGWDAALAWGQKVALGSVLGATRHIAFPSLVLTRTPDHGFSPAGDGADYEPEWTGADLPTMEYVVSQILYAAPELARGLVQSFLSTAAADGAVDGRPGPGGQLARWLCPPQLAGLSWKIYQRTDDIDFLRACLPALLKLFWRWFAEDRDPDARGLPTWEHAAQAGAEARPVFATAAAWGEGVELRHVIAPDLLARLAMEAEALVHMANVLGEVWDRSALEQRREALRQALIDAWSPASATFQYLDRDTRQTSFGMHLAEGSGPFHARPRKTFGVPARLTIRVAAPEGKARRLRVVLEGKGPRNRSRRELLTARRFAWLWDSGTADSEGVFTRLDSVRVEGLGQDVPVVVRAAGLDRQDLTLLLPLAVETLAPGDVEAAVRSTLMNPERYGRPSGWPAIPADDPAYAPGAPGGPAVVRLPLQTQIGEALVRAGFGSEAYTLLERTMSCLAQVLRTEGAFREAYHPEQAEGSGRRDHVAGIAPLSLFLAVAGVSLLSPNRVELEGPHRFRWPVTIRWRGLTVTRSSEGTRVVFPDGSETFVDPGVEGVVERSADG
ncbi:MAG TPA: hypothetical protein VLD63_12005 [Anaerolineales bacterium]|nr:hypothetical protein [Anaerolineales bacterium]